MSSAAAVTDLVIGVTLFWVALAFAGLLAPRNLRYVSRMLFPLGSAAAAVLAVCGALALNAEPVTRVLVFGLPDLPFHIRLDPLSGFFLMVLGVAAVGVSLFSAGYFRQGEGAAPGLLALQYHLFLAAMAVVMLADDAYLFMVAWETMAMASYFLVTTSHRIPEVRRAGFLYLLVAHVGAIAILLCFGAMQGAHGGQGNYTFAAMREAPLDDFWMSVAFLLALFGFGAKAGFLPLHAWLPEAHPAAPSPVSALMSGVMLKTAIYGLLRVTFDLLGAQLWWWGVVALAVGLMTTLFGVMFAAVQTDMKRLLAYSSIENIGIVLVGIGLTVLFHAYHMESLAALALIATLYHVVNHALFKSLLFLVTGSVLHSTRSRSLGKLGGLIHDMPWVASVGLIGALAIAGLPPLNGFVSEWLLLQAFLFSPGLPNHYLNMLVPVAAAALVLAAALAGYVMVKFYGVIFLGQRREPNLGDVHDAGGWERAGLVWLALGCIALGLAPVTLIAELEGVSQLLVGSGLADQVAASGWLYLAPVSAERASYSPALFLLGIVAVVALAFVLVRHFYHGRVRRADPWDCGFPQQTPRMQDTAEGFGQPIKQIFEPFFHIERHVPSPFDAKPYYEGSTGDRLWRWLYLPTARAIERLSQLVAVLQHGRIHIYLLYSFVTLLTLILLVR